MLLCIKNEQSGCMCFLCNRCIRDYVFLSVDSCRDDLHFNWETHPSELYGRDAGGEKIDCLICRWTISIDAFVRAA